MRIEIGELYTGNKEEQVIAIEIPGLGFLPSQKDDENPWSYIDLNRKQLKVLRKEIDKELSNG